MSRTQQLRRLAPAGPVTAALAWLLLATGCIGGPGLEPPGEGSASRSPGAGTVSAPPTVTPGGGGAGGTGSGTGAGGTGGSVTGGTTGTAGTTGAPAAQDGTAGSQGGADDAGTDDLPSASLDCQGTVVPVAPESTPLLDAGPSPDSGVPAVDGGGAPIPACDFGVPDAAVGTPVDQVAVALEVDGGTRYPAGILDESHCDPLRGGFHYDDPLAPTELHLCPASCALLGPGDGVHLVLGCAPPRP
ncbi:MAG: hypothetical protein PVI30_04345 [Myxococcales bacterium]|jgi:hypothetical protein